MPFNPWQFLEGFLCLLADVEFRKLKVVSYPAKVAFKLRKSLRTGRTWNTMDHFYTIRWIISNPDGHCVLERTL